MSFRPGKKVWRDEAARKRLECWFDRFKERIPGPVESREVSSRYGPSHVLLAGQPDGPPLVCLHAMRTGSAFLVSELGPLLDRFRIIAPDLPWQSVHGPQIRLPLTDNSHTQWLSDVLNELELGTVSLFGVSWGGFIARHMASASPERIDQLALLVPAGIVNGPHLKGFTNLALPLLQYRMKRSKKNLQRLIDPLFTIWDDDWAGYTGDAVSDMPFDPRIPPLATDQELQSLSMSVLALGAEDDISFPGEPLVRRILDYVPNASGEVIPACKHCPPTTPQFRDWLAGRLTPFFEGKS